MYEGRARPEQGEGCDFNHHRSGNVHKLSVIAEEG
jgi:hypothetical protein